MHIEKTTTGVIIREPTIEVKKKCLEYFSLSNPVREFFVYSGNDPDNKPRFGTQHDVIYITSGFLSIKDKFISTLHPDSTKKAPTPKLITLNMNREPRSDLQRDCIKQMCESNSPKITIELKPGVGKAEPYSRKIPTPTDNGFTPMGDLKIGDYVFAQDGTPTKVIGIFEQGEQDIYKITFQDGRVAYCHEDHLWTVKTHKNGIWKTRVLKDMIKDFKRESKWKKEHGRDDPYSYKYYIPQCNPVQYPHKDVPIDPWVLGCFIGNGCCTMKQLTISCPDDTIPNKIAELYGFRVRRDPSNYNYTFYDSTGKSVKTTEFFKQVPELASSYSRDKVIPIDYMINDVETRLSLLQGLMDTDGSVSVAEGRYHLVYSSTSKKLLEQIIELLYSFGYSGSIIDDKRSEKYVNNYCGSVLFRVPHVVKPMFFRNMYKKIVATEALSKTQFNYYNDLLIKDISFSHRENCRCIMVDNPAHMYLTEDFIVTHNTFIALYASAKLGYKPLIVAPTSLLKNQWIDNIVELGIEKKEIATKIWDAPDKKVCVVTISSLEGAIRDDWNGLMKTLDQSGFGIKVVDEAHLHLKGMLKFDALCNIKHNWYLSATLGRSSADEDRILNRALSDAERFIGSNKYEEYQHEYVNVYLQDIYYYPSNKLCDECFKYGSKGLIRSTYYNMLMKYKNGEPYINNIITVIKRAKTICNYGKILVIVPLLETIKLVMGKIENDPYFKNISYAYVDGSLKMKERSEAMSKQLILSTTMSMGTGVDIPDLAVLINFDGLKSSITSEQIVGRNRVRKDDKDCFYIDVCDYVKQAKIIANWGRQRRILLPYFPGVKRDMKRLPPIHS